LENHARHSLNFIQLLFIIKKEFKGFSYFDPGRNINIPLLEWRLYNIGEKIVFIIDCPIGRSNLYAGRGPTPKGKTNPNLHHSA
jgi:hypothetical protein